MDIVYDDYTTEYNRGWCVTDAMSSSTSLLLLLQWMLWCYAEWMVWLWSFSVLIRMGMMHSVTLIVLLRWLTSYQVMVL